MSKAALWFLAAVLLINSYVSLRSAAWSEMVAAPYMVALQKQIVCDKYVVIENRIPILERAIGLPWAEPAGGVLDTSKCDTSQLAWEDYEKSRKDYLEHRWGAFLKRLTNLEK